MKAEIVHVVVEKNISFEVVAHGQLCAEHFAPSFDKIHYSLDVHVPLWTCEAS